MSVLLTLLFTATAAFGAKQLWLLVQLAKGRMMSPSDVWDIAVMGVVFAVTALFWCTTWRTRRQEARVRARRPGDLRRRD
jgi:hypothetical protein